MERENFESWGICGICLYKKKKNGYDFYLMVYRTKFRLWYFYKICGTKILFLKSHRENAEREWEKDMAALTNSAHVHKMELTSTPFSFDAFHFLSSLQFKLKKLTHA